uniref:Immunoglobulin V-set domain-containing protein n=1 Tax=Dicentrarchus labrax TaxID=13489 RepID=A0A8C4DPC4_DICLA
LVLRFERRSFVEFLLVSFTVNQTCDTQNPSPFAMYLKRRWLQPGEVLYMHTETELHVKNNDYISRAIASGDPSSHSLNVTISQLRASDTDRYYCEFYVGDNLGLDKPLPESTEFFLLVNAGEFSLDMHYLILYLILQHYIVLVPDLKIKPQHLYRHQKTSKSENHSFIKIELRKCFFLDATIHSTVNINIHPKYKFLYPRYTFFFFFLQQSEHAFKGIDT